MKKRSIVFAALATLFGFEAGISQNNHQTNSNMTVKFTYVSDTETRNYAEERLAEEVRQSGTVRKTVSYMNREVQMTADLYLPKNFDASKQYAAIVVSQPGTGVKEQTAGLYANWLAGEGFVAIAYDPAYQAQSNGEPRYLEDPAVRARDIRYTIDFLQSLPYVDGYRIGAVGICGGGGYTVFTALTDKRIKALATISGSNLGDFNRNIDPRGAIAALEQAATERTLKNKGKAASVTQSEVRTTAEASAEVPTPVFDDVDLQGVADYYGSTRGYSPNRKLVSYPEGTASMFSYDAFHLADRLLNQPLRIFIGSRSGIINSPADGRRLYELAVSNDKELVVVEGASHFDLYDLPEYTTKIVKELTAFFGKTLKK